MTTPLQLARSLRTSFPRFIEVRVVRDGPGKLRAYCAITDESARIDAEALASWSTKHIALGLSIAFEQVLQLPPDADDEEALLRRTAVPRVVAEMAVTSAEGVLKTVRALFPTEILDVVCTAGHVTVHVESHVPAEREQILLDSTRLLLGADPISLTISRQPPPQGRPIQHADAEAAGTFDRLRADRARLYELLPDVLTLDNVDMPELPSGSSTYASVHDGIDNLLHRLALFDRVYLYVPFQREDFRSWAGATLEDFLDVLPTGRVIPVFGQRLDRYDPGLMTQILEGGAPRVMLQGEHALWLARGIRKDHPALARLESPDTIELRRTLAESDDERARRFAGYLDALARIPHALAATAICGDTLAAATCPIAEWIDSIRVAAGQPERSLELIGALEHRAIAEAIHGVPMSRVGHYFDSALRFVYAAEREDNAPLHVPDPTMIGRICFPDATGLTPREFADSFRGPRVEAMRELMASERVQTADGNVDLVRRFNEELRVYGRRSEREYVALITVLTVVGAFALGAPIAIASLSVDLARRIAARKSPAAFASLSSAMTATTREAALLARVQANTDA